MIAFICILLLILLILFIPVSLKAYYDGQFRMSFHILFLKIDFPINKGKKKKKKKSKKNKQPIYKTKTDNKLLLSQLSGLKKLLPILLKRAFAMLTVKRLKLKITVASDDPCATALSYGSINAAVGAVLKILEHHLKIKKKDISVTPDFSKEQTEIEFQAIVYTTLFRLILCIIRLLSDKNFDLNMLNFKSKEK